MGNKQNKVKENPNFNIQEYNQRMMNSGVYGGNRVRRLPDTNVSHMPESQIVQETVDKVVLTYSLITNSLHLKPSLSNQIEVEFKVKFKEGGKIMLYLSTQQSKFGALKSQFYQQEWLPPSSNQIAVNKVFRLNNHFSSLNLQRPYVKDWYPLIIVMGNQHQNLTTYVRTAHNFSKTIVIKQKLTNNGKIFYLKQVYGLAKDLMCIICLSQTADTMINPCGHISLCLQCAKLLMKSSETCPVCRGAITNYVHVTQKNANR